VSTKRIQVPDWLESPTQVAALASQLEAYRTEAGEAKRRKKALSKGSEPALPADLAVLAVDGKVTTIAATLKRLAKSPVVHVTLAALPGSRVKRDVIAWIRAIRPDVLVEFHVDRTIAGGLLVRTTHHIHDFSWRERLWTNRKRLAELADVR
jgi:hypothetical protein